VANEFDDAFEPELDPDLFDEEDVELEDFDDHMFDEDDLEEEDDEEDSEE